MNERVNLNTAVWGPGTWTFLHAFAASYPEKADAGDRAKARQFLAALQFALPCTHCREEYGKMLTETPPRVGGRDALERWVWRAHVSVNRRLGKPDGPTLAQTRARLAGETENTVSMVVAVVAVMVMAVLLCRRHRALQVASLNGGA